MDWKHAYLKPNQNGLLQWHGNIPEYDKELVIYIQGYFSIDIFIFEDDGNAELEENFSADDFYWCELENLILEMGDSVKRKSISKITRQLVLEKYDCHCAYCGKTIDIKTLRVDHLEPFRNGGANEISNYMPSCQSCNFYKSTLSLEKFREQLMSVHERIMKSFISRLGADYGIVEIKPFDGIFYFEKIGNGE